MTKKEKQIYKSGKENPNGYKFSIFDYFKKRRTPIIIIILIILTLFLEFLNVFRIADWNEVTYLTGIIDGVKPKDSDFVIYYLDVGQSDCTIIVCDDEVMMIDTGTRYQVFNIRKSLFTLGIDSIDYMIVTHPHYDHVAGAYDLVNHYTVHNIMMPAISDNSLVETEGYPNLINAIADKEVNPIAISSGYSFKLGSASVEVLSPFVQDENLNNMSTVIKITYGETSFLFQGDAESEIEKQLINSDYDISSDVLKVGHHGSDTSSHNSFLEAVNPDYAVISSGIANTYGHPNYNVIERLLNHDIELLVTSLDGHIIITSNGKEISITKQQLFSKKDLQ